MSAILLTKVLLALSRNCPRLFWILPDFHKGFGLKIKHKILFIPMNHKKSNKSRKESFLTSRASIWRSRGMIFVFFKSWLVSNFILIQTTFFCYFIEKHDKWKSAKIRFLRIKFETNQWYIQLNILTDYIKSFGEEKLLELTFI